MTFKRKAAGAWTDIATTIKRNAAGSWVQVGSVKRRLSGAWVTIWSAAAVTDQSITSMGPTGTRTAGYRLNTSGIAESRVQADYSTIETWLVVGAASDYEVRATLVTGDALTSGVVGTWQALSTSQEWRISVTTPGTKLSELLIEIRTTAGVVVDSATVTLAASDA